MLTIYFYCFHPKLYINSLFLLIKKHKYGSILQ